MAFDIRRLDGLDYDDAEPLLEDYIIEAIEAFAESDIGQVHMERFPKGGDWIGTFIEMAYLYGGFTLSKMTKANAQEVMEYILPRKLALLDPSDTDGAIDELVAFWQFLAKTYRLRSGNAIAAYLQSIADKFPQWMFDPARGGMAKNVMMQGLQAGYDMTSPEGLKAFQAEYNRNLPAQSPNLAEMPDIPIPMDTPPADMKAIFDQLGLELPEMGQPVNLKTLAEQFLGALEQLDPVEAEQLIASMEDDLDDLDDLDDASIEAPPSAAAGSQSTDLRTMLLQDSFNQDIPLTEAEQALLRDTTISETGPGTILQDFQITLDFIGADGVPVSGKLQHLSLKLLGELNGQLSHPIAIDLKRPQQKSYPNIHGLYLLLRATGITEVVAKGKQLRLRLHPDVYASWQQLNPAERYFTLLEAWFLRSHPEMLGEERSGPLTMGDRCLKVWPTLHQKTNQIFSDYGRQDSLAYWPGFYNVALMEMFGFVELTHGKPDPGKGWRLKKLMPCDWGNALMKLLFNAHMAVGLQWPSAMDATQPLGDLQPILHPYFPDWQQTLAVPSSPFRPGRHIFNVSLGNIWRRIGISGEATLADLSQVILDSVGFDRDHLDQFTYKSPTGRTVEVMHPGFTYDESLPTTVEVLIGSLPLSEGGTMEYLFDFGDCWRFQVQLETIDPEADSDAPSASRKTEPAKRRRAKKQRPVGEVLAAHGEAPEQYPV